MIKICDKSNNNKKKIKSLKLLKNFTGQFYVYNFRLLIQFISLSLKIRMFII